MVDGEENTFSFTVLGSVAEALQIKPTEHSLIRGGKGLFHVHMVGQGRGGS